MPSTPPVHNLFELRMKSPICNHLNYDMEIILPSSINRTGGKVDIADLEDGCPFTLNFGKDLADLEVVSHHFTPISHHLTPTQRGIGGMPVPPRAK